VADLIEKLYEPKRNFTKPQEGPFVPKIKITVEDTKSKQIKQFVVESSFSKHTEKDTQARIREDLQVRLNLVLDQVFMGWK
jgi:hypothetical protein